MLCIYCRQFRTSTRYHEFSYATVFVSDSFRRRISALRTCFAAYAVGIKNHSFCGQCGSPTTRRTTEHAKECPHCGLVAYPRISPAIIVAITRNNTILLAHNAAENHPFYSVLAGFLEPGESFENCVKREVFEEVQIRVKNIRYFGSQPWPFPDSLMVAFTADYDSGTIAVDGVELDHADWFTSNNLPAIPRSGSISRKLIDWFLSNAQ